MSDKPIKPNDPRFYSPSLLEYVGKALETNSAGGEHVTSVEARRATEALYFDQELSTQVFDALQSVDDGAALSASEIQQIEKLQNGHAFLTDLDQQQDYLNSYRLFAKDCGYGKKLGNLDHFTQGLQTVAEATGVTITVPWAAIYGTDIPFLQDICDGKYNAQLIFAREQWHVSRLSLAGVSDLIFVLDPKNNYELPAAKKVQRVVDKYDAELPNHDSIIDGISSDLSIELRYSLKLDGADARDVARQSTLISEVKKIFPNSLVDFSTSIGNAVTDREVTFLKDHADGLEVFFGAHTTIDASLLYDLTIFCRAHPEFLDNAKALAQAGLCLEMSGTQTIFGNYAEANFAALLPWGNYSTKLVLQRTKELAALLPEKRLVLTQWEALASYMQLVQSDEGFAFLKSLLLPELDPASQTGRFNDFLFLAYHRGLPDAVTLEKMWPPLKLDDHDVRIEQVLILPQEDMIKIGAELRQSYAAVLGGNTFSPSDYVLLYEQRNVLLDPDFKDYFLSYVKAFRFSVGYAKAALLINNLIATRGDPVSFKPLISGPYPKTPEQKARTHFAMELLVDLYDADAFKEDAYKNTEAMNALLLQLQTCSETDLALFIKFKNIGLVASFVQGVQFLLNCGSLGNTYMKSLIDKGVLQERWLKIKDTAIKERDFPVEILTALAAWPEEHDHPYDDIQNIFASQKKLTGDESVFLAESVYFGLSPSNQNLLQSPPFASWLTRLHEQYPQILLSGDDAAYESPLAILTHIYASGKEEREKIFKPAFAADWAELSRLSQTPYGAYDPFTALVLLQYPQVGQWKDFEKFVKTFHDNKWSDAEKVEGPSRRAKKVSAEFGIPIGGTKPPALKNNVYDLYKVFWLIKSSKAAKELFTNIVEDPSYGMEYAYAKAPILRPGTAGDPAHDERPNWETLNPVTKFVTILIKRQLEGNSDLRDIVAGDMLQDIYDKTAEHGGGIFVSAGDDKGIIKNLRGKTKEMGMKFVTAPSMSVIDGMFTSLDPCYNLGLSGFHFHALENDNSQYAGPSSPDYTGAVRSRRVNVVITSTGEQNTEAALTTKFDVDVFGYAHSTEEANFGAVVDLGEYSRVIDKKDDADATVIVTAIPFGHDKDYVREFEISEELPEEQKF